VKELGPSSNECQPETYWAQQDHFGEAESVRLPVTICPEENAFQVGHGVLQYVGRKQAHFMVDETILIVQDRAEKKRFGLGQPFGVGNPSQRSINK
jgi:hypothetical protein